MKNSQISIPLSELIEKLKQKLADHMRECLNCQTVDRQKGCSRANKIKRDIRALGARCD